MKRQLAAILVAASAMITQAADVAEACGVKLTVKSNGPRKATARSSNPSDILVLGDPPRKLQNDLTAKGHRVEVAPHAADAKRKSYAVVVTDAPLLGEARSSFPDAVVLVRTDDATADVRTVEQQVARRPVRTGDRAVVAAAARRSPVAAGPSQPPSRPVVAAAPPSEPAPETPPPAPAAPERVATTVQPPPRERPAAPAAVAPQSGDVKYEVYFALGATSLSTAGSRSLNAAIRWMKTNSDVQVVIEGHADPSGTPDINLAIGQKRAEWMRDYLVQAGIDAGRIDVISYGDTRLKYGRASSRNRRAAIVVK